MNDPAVIEQETRQKKSASQKQTKSKARTVLSSSLATGFFLSTSILVEGALGDHSLEGGMKANDVKVLQQALKEQGYFTYHTATGFYGDITVEAVKAFQKANNLSITGRATVETLQQSVKSASAATKSSVLRQGSTGQEVSELQKLLKQAGYYKHEVNGQYGRVTTEAVKSFQRNQKLAVDGIAGPKTITALQNITAMTIEPVSNVSEPKPVLRSGSSGQAVQVLQERLQQLGYYKEKITGQFDTKTKEAVKTFQKQNLLTVDGVVGPKTWAVLESAKAVGTTQQAQPILAAEKTATTTL
ncbi:peptidoglycan-binding domain-containing protein [Halalkalibacter urbisdiaboli]|uniref:peptidoglycan-binding domain-containing protein n=1 Tax=Halalkalibacter urbisdiaboli TaxID=1960589 RepID=UPI0013FDC628|nr:peptidoglycan-binding protein [Halalkalibacter urbisdiaboli]